MSNMIFSAPLNGTYSVRPPGSVGPFSDEISGLSECRPNRDMLCVWADAKWGNCIGRTSMQHEQEGGVFLASEIIFLWLSAVMPP